jgi:hypothetical protein
LKDLKFQAVNWPDAHTIGGEKHRNRFLDLAVVAVLSLLIMAALVHAGGQLRAAETGTRP